MTYTIKRLREEGHFCLSSLDAVESLDVFWAEATKVARLYIEDTNVYVAPTKTKRSEGEFEGLACRRDNNYKTRLVFVSKPTDIDSLRSISFRILCLPEINPQSMKLDGIDYLPSKPGDRYKQLFFTTEQLRHIICAHPSRQYTFSRFSLTGAQSVEIISHRKFAIEVNWCQFDDKGQAIVDWLEDRNEKEIIDSCYFPQCDCVEKLFTFLSRSLYPVFNKLYLTGKDVESKSSLSPLIAAANVNTLMVDIKFFLCNEGWRAPLLKALQNGTFRPRNLEVNFSSNDLFGFDEDDLRLISKFLSKFFEAISSPDCSLKELHLKHIDDDYTNISRTMEDYLLYRPARSRTRRAFSVMGAEKPCAQHTFQRFRSSRQKAPSLEVAESLLFRVFAGV